VPKAKPCVIPKQLVWDAYQRVKANRGAAGVEGESRAACEHDLKGNRYKVGNRMSAGSYVPPPVRLVEIPKASGGTRPLGIPTVADRVAQTVGTRVLEPLVEPSCHPDSYGYRPGRSALDAVGVARRRCWDTDWVIDRDSKACLESLPQALVERAVAHHTALPWVRLYIARWLRAPVQRPDGTLEPRTKGTPQGGGASPLRANLFLHYACDAWMQRSFPRIRFERYADDSLVHCGSAQEAQAVLAAIRGRFAQCGLEVHPTKTRIVYCKDDDRPGGSTHGQFDFLGDHLPTSTGEESLGEVLRELPARDQHLGRYGDPADHPRVANGLHQEQPVPGGPGPARQPRGPWLDELLRPLLSGAVGSSPAASQRGPGGLGAMEVHPVPASRARVDALAWPHRAPRSPLVCVVGARRPAGRWRVRAG